MGVKKGVMMSIKALLKEKGSDVWSVDLQTGLRDVLKFMDEKNIGAVLVKDENKIAGIFSERDLLRSSALKGPLPEDTPIREIMTKKVLFVSPSESIEECMFLMSAKKIRHLPVIDNDKLVGMISIGDIVDKVIESQRGSIEQLEKYISGQQY
jgi:CBS domain-containing protein